MSVDPNTGPSGADPREKSVHAGHLFHVSINPKRVMLTDLKFGQQNLAIRPAYQKKSLNDEQKALLASKTTATCRPRSSPRSVAARGR